MSNKSIDTDALSNHFARPGLRRRKPRGLPSLDGGATGPGAGDNTALTASMEDRLGTPCSLA